MRTFWFCLPYLMVSFIRMDINMVMLPFLSGSYIFVVFEIVFFLKKVLLLVLCGFYDQC